MRRRDMVLAMLAVGVAARPQDVLAQVGGVDIPVPVGRTFLNGELNELLGTFDYTNGGGDPLWERWKANNFRRTLAMPRMNLTEETQDGLRGRLAQPGRRINMATLYEGQVIGDLMVSGDGWIALRPRLVSSRWQPGRSTMATWRSWINPVTHEHWEIIVPDVCHNLVLKRRGQALPCVCIEEAGDACPAVAH